VSVNIACKHDGAVHRGRARCSRVEPHALLSLVACAPLALDKRASAQQRALFTIKSLFTNDGGVTYAT
jgi:hypothetical protein